MLILQGCTTISTQQPSSPAARNRKPSHSLPAPRGREQEVSVGMPRGFLVLSAHQTSFRKVSTLNNCLLCSLYGPHSTAFHGLQVSGYNSNGGPILTALSQGGGHFIEGRVDVACCPPALSTQGTEGFHENLQQGEPRAWRESGTGLARNVYTFINNTLVYDSNVKVYLQRLFFEHRICRTPDIFCCGCCCCSTCITKGRASLFLSTTACAMD